MADDPGRELTRALTGRARTPESLEDIASVYGDIPRHQNPALARELTGLPPTGRLPARGTAERRAYEATLRSVQRYRAGEGRQRRRPGRDTLRRLRAAARLRLAGPRLAQVRRLGILMRLTAEIRVSRVWRTHHMPSDVAGRPRMVHVGPELMRPVLDAWEAGDVDQAGAQLLEAFFTAYWGEPEPAEMATIERVQLRLPGEV
jgi:hypothetical protein